MSLECRNQLCPLVVPKDADLDIVAVHGLAAERHGFTTEETWTCGDKLWLRDFLAPRLPRARIFLFGYDSDQAFKASINGVRSQAECLLERLRSIRETQQERPLIFICHSLGGLVVKQALTLANLHDIYVKIQKSTCRIAFFGTPHRKTNEESLGLIAARIAACSAWKPGRTVTTAEWSLTESLTKSLVTDQLFADDITETLNECLADYRIVNFCETKGYSLGVIVPEASGTLGLSAGREAVYHIDSDHYHMCKFKDADQESYKLVERIFLDLAKSAQDEYKARISQENFKQLELKSIFNRPNTYFLVPYKRNPYFTGREKKLEYISQSFASVEGEQCQRVVLLGEGGIGKSAIALEYIYQLRDARPHHSIFWIRAASHERFFETYLKILRRQSIAKAANQYTDIIGVVKDWLARDDIGSWTIVIDDVEDMDFCVEPKHRSRDHQPDTGTALARFVPECSHGSLIFLTRSPTIGNELLKGFAKNLVEVTPLSVEESERMMRSRLGGVDQTSQLNKLTSLLGYSPLAMTQAAACIRGGALGLREYVSRLESWLVARTVWLASSSNDGAADVRFNASIATLAISQECIDPSNIFTSGLLTFVALFDSHAIPVSAFESFWPEISKGTRSLKVLESYSLIEYNVDCDFIDVHGMIRSNACGRLSEREKDKIWVPEALTSLQNLCPTGEYLDLEACAMLLPHILSVLEHSSISAVVTLRMSDVLFDAGLYLRSQGQWVKAEKMEIDVLEARERLLGAWHPSTMISMASLASLYSNTGRWHEATQLQGKLVSLGIQTVGIEHPETRKRMTELASTYKSEGRWEEAEKIEAQVLEACQEIFGREHPRTWPSMANLASTYSIQGRLTAAEELAAPATAAIRKALGARHPDTLNSMANLASILVAQGKFDQAGALTEFIFATSSEVLGPEHPDTLSSLSNLALIYSKQGRWDKAEKLEKDVVEASLKILGMDHPDSLTSMNNLASTYRNQGKLEQAEVLQTQVVEKRLEVLGEEHPDMFMSKVNLASIYQKQGRWKEAEKLEVQVMEISQRLLGREHPYTLKIASNLAETQRNQDRLSEAIALMKPVVELRTKILGPNHPDTVHSIDLLEAWSRT